MRSTAWLSADWAALSLTLPPCIAVASAVVAVLPAIRLSSGGTDAPCVASAPLPYGRLEAQSIEDASHDGSRGARPCGNQDVTHVGLLRRCPAAPSHATAAVERTVGSSRPS